MSTAQTVHFTIHGEDLTRLARDRMLDDNPGSAWRIANSLIGDGVAEAAIAILSGTKKLIGKDSSIDLVDDKTEYGAAYRKQLAWLYAGRKKVNGLWYQPIAVVTSFGINDLRNNHGVSTRQVWGGSGILNRQWHYAHLKNEIAIEHSDVGDIHGDTVIFQACGERPHWQAEPLTPEAMIKEYVDAERGLQERGHALWYPEEGNNGPYSRPPHDYPHAKPVGISGDFVGVSDERTPVVSHLDRDTTEEDRIADLEDQVREESRLRRQSDLQLLILKQADGDLIELSWPASKLTEQEEAWGRKPTPAGWTLVPRAPFIRWAFNRNERLLAKAPPWKPISPPGMKLMNDDQNHTDWIVGGGFDLDKDRQLYYYSGAAADAAMGLASKFQDEFDDEYQKWLASQSDRLLNNVHVLNTVGSATGVVYYGKRNRLSPPGSIVVLPNLDPKYLAATTHAVALITEEGGELAHLVQVGRENQLPIVRVPNALSLFTEGMSLAINTVDRTIMQLGATPHVEEPEDVPTSVR